MDALSSDEESNYVFDSTTLLADLSVLEESNAKLLEFVQEYTASHRRVINALRTSVLTSTDKWYKQKSKKLRKYRKSLGGAVGSPAPSVEEGGKVTGNEGGVADAQRLLDNVSDVISARKAEVEGIGKEKVGGEKTVPKGKEKQPALGSRSAPVQPSSRSPEVTKTLSSPKKTGEQKFTNAEQTLSATWKYSSSSGFTAVYHPKPSETTPPAKKPVGTKIDQPKNVVVDSFPNDMDTSDTLPPPNSLSTMPTGSGINDAVDPKRTQPFRKVQTAICSVRRGGKRKSLNTRKKPEAEQSTSKADPHTPSKPAADAQLQRENNMAAILLSSSSPEPEKSPAPARNLATRGRGTGRGGITRSTPSTRGKRPASPALPSPSQHLVEISGGALPTDPQVFSKPTMLAVFNGSLRGPIWHITHSKRSSLQFLIVYDGEFSLDPLAEPKLLQRVSLYDLSQYERIAPYCDSSYPNAPIFQRVHDNEFLYLGFYKFEQYEKVTFDEWKKFPEYVKRNWAKEIAKGDEFAQDYLFDAGLTQRKKQKVTAKEVAKWFYAKGGETDNKGEIALSKIVFEPLRWERKMYDALVEAHGEDNPVFLSSFMEAATPPPPPKEDKDKHTSSAAAVVVETPRPKRQKTDHGGAAPSSLTSVAPMAGTTGNQQTVKNTPRMSIQPNGIETQSAQDNALSFPLTAPEGPANKRKSMGQRGVRNRGARDDDDSDVEETRQINKRGIGPSGNRTRLSIDSALSD